MGTRSMTKFGESMPSVFNDFFKPWNEWFDEGGIYGRIMNIPAVNITEQKNDFNVELAVPGMQKDDFKVDIDGNLLTISCEKEEKKEKKEEKYTRKEYNYSSFSRCFTLPDDINKDKVEANYENGILKLVLPKKEEAKKPEASKHINVK